MATRYDNKKRVLHVNEYQNKDGRYVFHYTDAHGKKCKVYSLALKPEDIPELIKAGKKCDVCLRDLEKQILTEKAKRIVSPKKIKKTVNNLFEINLARRNLRQSTETNYRYMYNKFIKPVFGYRFINMLTQDDIEEFYTDLLKNQKFAPSTLEGVHNILSPVFDTAVAKQFIGINPCIEAMKEIRRRFKAEWAFLQENKSALTIDQQVSFMNYVKANYDKYGIWYNLLVVFLGTGCRVSEITGLTWNDIDFERNTITINHQLHYGANEYGKFQKSITPPKNKSSIREIQMFQSVRAALLDEKARQEITGKKCNDVVNGYIIQNKKRIEVQLTDFVFLNRFGLVQLPHNTNRAFERIRNDYNKHEIEVAKQEERKPIILQHFTNHVLRHTFTTRACECQGVNIGFISDMLGHSDTQTTLNIYNDVQAALKKKTIEDLENKIIIG